MAEYTVSDILGVGFKYEQYAEEQVVPQATGTKAVVVGTSTWGPVNTPKYITNGLREFKDTFGYAGTLADEGWEGAASHFAFSSVGYYTRVASSVNPPSRSYRTVVNNATKAFLTSSNTLGTTLRLYPSAHATPRNTFDYTLRHKTGTMTTHEDLSFAVNFETAGLTSEPGFVTGNYSTSGTFENGQTVSFKVYNESGSSVGTFTYTAGGTVPITSASSYVSALLGSGSIAAGQGVHFTLSSSGNTVTLTTAPYYYGASARVEVLSDNFGLLAGKSDYGTDPLRSTVLSYLNSVVTSKSSPANSGNTLGVLYGSTLTFATLNADNKLVLTSPSSGSTAVLTLGSGNFNGLVGLSNAASSSGVDAKTVGTFRAVYRGSEGNLIRVVVSGSTTSEPKLQVFFRGSLIGSANLYNFVSGSVNNLSTLISDSSVLSQVLRYDHAKTYTEFNESDDVLSTGEVVVGVTSSDVIGDGEYVLSGGTDGSTNVSVANDVVPALVTYANEDLYDVDFIAAPGYPEQEVHNAMLFQVCEVRKDCFALLDMPDFGTSSAAEDRAIAWTNGKYTGRTVKLDSYYGYVAYPYVKLRKQLYNSNMEIEGVLGDYSPTARLTGTISRSDFISKTKFAAPAGENRGGLPNIEGVRKSVNQAERDRLYADVYDNCINPVMFNLTGGFFVNGQKSTLRKNANGRLTALSRLNVVRIGLYIKKEIAKINPRFFHEPNDQRLRTEYAAQLSRIMSSLVSTRAILEDYLIVCDDTVNTDSVVNNNGLVAVIDFTPIKTVERIKVIANIKERNTTVTVANV